MLPKTLAASAATLALFASQTALATPSCWSVQDYDAVQVQNLDTLLMIEALKCENTIPELRASYDEFANGKRDLIVSSKRAVQAHFVRQHGYAGGQDAYLRYETSLGNQQGAHTATYDRCEQMLGLTRLAVGARDADLPALAQVLARSDAKLCRAPDESRKMKIDVWSENPPRGALRAPVQVTSTVLARPPAPPVPASPVPATAKLADAAPKDRTEAEAAMAPPAAPAPKADPATALAAAAAALAEAAEAMKGDE